MLYIGEFSPKEYLTTPGDLILLYIGDFRPQVCLTTPGDLILLYIGEFGLQGCSPKILGKILYFDTKPPGNLIMLYIGKFSPQVYLTTPGDLILFYIGDFGPQVRSPKFLGKFLDFATKPPGDLILLYIGEFSPQVYLITPGDPILIHIYRRVWSPGVFAKKFGEISGF